MRSLVKRRVDIKYVALVATILLLVTLLIFQLPANAVNTFPHQYELVSVNNVDGQGVDRHAKVEGVSYNGSKVLFSSPATNLPSTSATSTNQVWAGYMRDMNTASTARVDVSASGVIPDQSTGNYVMNTTGRYIAFTSKASNLIDGSSLDTSVSRVYFKDLQTNTVELLVNIPNIVIGGYATSSSPISVSDDGRFVMMMTNRINSLIPGTRSGNGGGYKDFVMYDRAKSTWTLINKSADGTMQNVDTGPLYTGMGLANASCDGSLIVFESPATNLTSYFSGSGRHIYLADTRNGVNITDITASATADSTVPDISCNGRYITYSTKDRTLITPTPSGMNTSPHLVRYDRFTGERKYIDTKSDNTTFNQSQLDGYRNDYTSSVTDKGDVILPYASLMILGSYRTTVQFKHLSDGSGTLENVEHTYAGLKYDFSYLPIISADGSYVIVSSRDGYELGVLSESPDTSDGPYDLLRIKTGL